MQLYAHRKVLFIFKNDLERSGINKHLSKFLRELLGTGKPDQHCTQEIITILQSSVDKFSIVLHINMHCNVLLCKYNSYLYIHIRPPEDSRRGHLFQKRLALLCRSW